MHRLRGFVVALCVLTIASTLVLGSSRSRADGPGADPVEKAEGESGRDKAGIPNEGPEGTWAAEQSKIRAYPADEVPFDAVENAIATFASLSKTGKKVGQWQPLGPERRAQYPAVLDQFLFDGAPYTASGRVTALAVGPSCDFDHCRVYLGAAGGGIWVTDKALSNNVKWSFATGSLGSNAIGSILMDPSDATGNTVYVATGEPNASGDSEAGIGIFKTTDGGQSWTLVPGSDMFFQRSIGQMAFDNAGNLLVPIASGVRGISSVSSGASSSGSTTHPLVTRGLYRQTGNTFTIIRPIVAVTTARGSTTVKVDPTHPGVIYVNEFSRGIWRSKDNGVNWTQIKTPRNPARSTDRAEFDVTTLANGRTRMYVGVGNQTNDAANHARFFVTDDASDTASFTDLTTAQNAGYCTAQCWYDNVVVTPAGSPDVVYLGGSFDYDSLPRSTKPTHGRNNGRAFLLSTDAGSTWSDLTQDGGAPHANGMHPDQHALVTVPGNPFQFIAGSDGGVIRSDGDFADISDRCDSRGITDPANVSFCKSLLWRAPNEITVMNDGLDTLQFQSLSVSPRQPKSLLQGGTQDNGTFQFNGSTKDWPQIIYGDGGNSGFNAANDALRVNTFTGQANDVNFRNGDPTAWVVVTGPIVSSPEGSFFYPPLIADPNPAPASANSIFQGSQSVWRTQDWGGNQAFLEANCPEFTTDAATPTCGDFVRIGPAGARDLTAPNAIDPSTTFGADRAGGGVAWLARAPQDTNTLWAATSTGRVFVSDNANAATATDVAWHRLDTGVANAPNRAISSISVDPANANHVWISYNGYNVNTPTRPGHVFEVSRNPSTNATTWVDRSYDLADFPVTALVRDDLTGDLYAGTDFAVFRLASGATTWTLTAGMPKAEIAGLTIVPSARVLYAATHGLGAWVMDLGKVK